MSPSTPSPLSSLTLRVNDGIRHIPAESWAALIGPDASPFLEHAWLRAMEESGCAAPAKGWLPHILSAWEGDRLVGAVPLYVKGNSNGEFVYDWGWADLADRIGVSYYPKLIAAVPFSPVSGDRLITHPALAPEAREATLRALIRASLHLTERTGVSGLHYLFVSEEHARLLQEEGFLLRTGFQYHWTNDEYSSFDDFLARFRSKKRVQIKRERRGVEEAGVRLEFLRGDQIDEALMDVVFRFYASTCDKFIWGHQYLNRDFFARVHRDLPQHLLVLIARDRSGTPVAGAFTLEKQGRLYGRYWGCTEEIRFLHFEVCCYALIEHAITQGFQLIEPGAGGGHKYIRGFEPTKTWSAHHIAHPRLRGILARHLEGEREAIDQEIARLRAESPLVHPAAARR